VPVKVTEGILQAVETSDAWQNWVTRLDRQFLEHLNPTPRRIFMSSDPDLVGIYENARAITAVWMMNMGGGIPIEVIAEFERFVDTMGVVASDR
jgi:hypothetical protein